jgi:hypothetical protein
MNTTTPDQSRRTIFDQIQLGISSDDVERAMNKPDRQGSNESDFVFLYTIIRKGKVLPRESFTFKKSDKKLIVKFLDFYDDDPESSVDYWKSRYPQGDFSVKSKTTNMGHYMILNQFINVNSELTLSINNNTHQVDQASWGH